MTEAASRFGGLDTIVCNAGASRAGTVANTSESDWDFLHGVILKGAFLTAREAWPHLLEAGGGSLTFTASIASTTAIPGDAPYCAAKAGVLLLMKSSAVEGAPLGIRANAVCPGFTETGMLTSWIDEQPNPAAARAEISAQQPLGRLGRPIDQANAFVYLASNEALWITGSSISVDGGVTAGVLQAL